MATCAVLPPSAGPPRAADGGKVARVERRLRTVERELGAVLAALDSLDAEDETAAAAANAGAEATLEPCDLDGRPNPGPEPARLAAAQPVVEARGAAPAPAGGEEIGRAHV